MNRPAPAAAAPAAGWSWVTPGFLVALVAIAVFEAAWFAWFLQEPLPNAWRKAPNGEPIRRAVLMWNALPGLIPNVSARSAILFLAANELGHVENLPQRGPIVLAASFIACAAVALGRLILRGLRLLDGLGRWERLPLAFGLGASGLGVLTLLIGRLGLLGPWPIRAGLGAMIVVEAVLSVLRWGRAEMATEARDDKRRRGPSWSAAAGFVLLAGPFLLTMALGAMLPSYDYDAIEYHLEGPREYYQAGRIAFLEHNVYTSMPFSVEMLHLLGMEVVDDWWWGALVGQLLVAMFAPAAAALIALTAGRWGSPRAAWVAAVVYLTTPWIYRLATIPYVEGPLCYFHAALVWSAGLAWTAPPDRRARRWALVGLLAGGAMACKYPALVSAVVPFGAMALVDAVRRRSWRIVVAFGLGVAVIIGPWLVKNAVDTGNPVYPLGFRVFGGWYWNAEQDAKWSAAHGPRPISADWLASSVLDVAGRSDWHSPLYTALAPLALLRRGSRRTAVALWGYVLYLFATWWLLTHRLDRFWLPLLPAAAVLAGLGADWVRDRGAKGMLWNVVVCTLFGLGFASNLVYTSTSLAGFNEWTSDLNRLRRRVPQSLNAPLTKLDEELPPGSKVLLVGQAAVFHLRHPVVYNTVFNCETFETLTKGASADRPYRDPEPVRRDLDRLGVDFVYVDWNEVARFRSPGNYGFTPFITRELFDHFVQAGVLERRPSPGPHQDLFRVRRPSRRP